MPLATAKSKKFYPIPLPGKRKIRAAVWNDPVVFSMPGEVEWI